MTASNVRAVGNNVNLGRLYQTRPWPPRPARNFVNLGHLFAKPPFKSPLSWGYFEDGSAYVNPKRWLPHDEFEAEMKALVPFVQHPSPNIQRTRTREPERGQLLVMAKGGLSPTDIKIVVRNYYGGQKAPNLNRDFEVISLTLDETRTRPISAEVLPGTWRPSPTHREKIRMALNTFRGTLINGTLQPNVRLPNGMMIKSPSGHNERALLKERGTQTSTEHISPGRGRSGALGQKNRMPYNKTAPSTREHATKGVRQQWHKPPQQVAHLPPDESRIRRREKELNRKEQQLVRRQQQLLSQQIIYATPPPLSKQLAYNVPNAETAEIESKERTLLLWERILKLQSKNLDLQTELALARGTIPQPKHLQNDRSSSAPTLEELQLKIDPADDSALAGAIEDTHSEGAPSDILVEENWSDPLAEFNIPPASLAKLRSDARLTLPRRRVQ